jgi:hypothetical protein
LLADVLEHIPKPEKQLDRLTSLQSNGSIFIISIPNIVDIRVMPNLLFGRSDYTDQGIMDRTHPAIFYPHHLSDIFGTYQVND